MECSWYIRFCKHSFRISYVCQITKGLVILWAMGCPDKHIRNGANMSNRSWDGHEVVTLELDSLNKTLCFVPSLFLFYTYQFVHELGACIWEKINLSMQSVVDAVPPWLNYFVLANPPFITSHSITIKQKCVKY
jgi:hypothetical protein